MAQPPPSPSENRLSETMNSSSGQTESAGLAPDPPATGTLSTAPSPPRAPLPAGFIPISRRSNAATSLSNFVAQQNSMGTSPPPPYSVDYSAPELSVARRSSVSISDDGSSTTVAPDPRELDDEYIVDLADEGPDGIETTREPRARTSLSSNSEVPATSPSSPTVPAPAAILSPFDAEPPEDTDLPPYAPSASPNQDINYLLRPVENIEAYLAQQRMMAGGNRATASRIGLSRANGPRIPVADLPFGGLTRPSVVVAMAPRSSAAGPTTASGDLPNDNESCITAVEEPLPRTGSQESLRRYPPEYYDPVFRRKVRRFMLCLWLCVMPVQVSRLVAWIWKVQVC